MSHLIIVESPAKAKTIEGYLGKNYKVASSNGHIRVLEKGNHAIDVKNSFKPSYVIANDKKSIISAIKKIVKTSETVYLASDDDREGEAIAWHLKEVLSLSDDKYKRIVFRSVTKKAILEAIQNPRKIDQNLVDSQKARRILDRLVGFELSPILWKKIQSGLSAGRVQSVAVRIIVEREREIEEFKSTSSFKVLACFSADSGKGDLFSAELNQKFATEKDCIQFFEKLPNALFSVIKVEKKDAKKSPTTPFTTSTLQQEASQKLGLSVSRTMSIAQKLYEKGYITYMRTDSVNLSSQAISEASDVISRKFGKAYVKTRIFKNKSKNAQEAHEAVRPINFSISSINEESKEQKLYHLIWQRALASQMSDAKLERTQAIINTTPELAPYNSKDLYFKAKGEVIVFEGFLKVYQPARQEDNAENVSASKILPPLKVNMPLKSEKFTGKQTFTQSPPRYSEATLVKKLEEKGIGRPSTYAPTVSTIQKRGYVEKKTNQEGKKRMYTTIRLIENREVVVSKNEETYSVGNNKLTPTNTAMIVNDFLVKHFPKITDYDFTKKVENQLDLISEGDNQWNKMLQEFYGDFHKTVENTEKLNRSEAGTIREIGVDKKNNQKVYGRLGRFGPYVQIGEISENVKPRYASLRSGQFIESITLEEALDLFKLPRDIGQFEGEVMTAAIGRFGPYVKHKNSFHSIPKHLDPHEIKEIEAIEVIVSKREIDAKKFIKSFDENPDIQLLNGRWGPYIKFGKKNIKLPNKENPELLTYTEVMEVINNDNKSTKKTKSKTKPGTKTRNKNQKNR